MTKNETTAFEKQARTNLRYSPKQLEKFIRQANALRRNLKLRQVQQQERQKECMHSK